MLEVAVGATLRCKITTRLQPPKGVLQLMLTKELAVLRKRRFGLSRGHSLLPACHMPRRRYRSTAVAGECPRGDPGKEEIRSADG